MHFDPTGGGFTDGATDGARLRALRVAGWSLLTGPALYLALIFLTVPVSYTHLTLPTNREV